MDSIPAKTNELRTGWRIVLASAVGVGLGLSAMPFYTLGVFAEPIAAEFGWDRGEIFFAVACMLLGSIFAAPVVGTVIDKYSVRRVVLISLSLFSVCLASLSLATSSLWSFYALWSVMALLSVGTTPLTWTHAINSWFDKQRGLALGLALAGTGVSAAILPIYATSLIAAIGWRGAYVALGATVAMIALPTVFFLFSDKASSDAEQIGEKKTAATGLSIKASLGSYRFWILAVALSLVSLGVTGLIANIVPLLSDQGYSATRAAAMAGLIGVTVVVGRVLAGFLIDRFWAPGVALVMLILPALSCLILADGGSGLLLTGMAVALIGLAAGAEFDLIAYLISKYFGMRNYGKVYSGLYFFFVIASGLAPAIFGAVYDRYSNYDLALYTASALFVLGALMFPMLGRYPDLKAAR